MDVETELRKWVVLWAIGGAYLVARHWRDGAGVGLLLTFSLSLGVIHWFPSALHLLPWFQSWDFPLVAEGMRQSAFGMLGLVAGAEIGAMLYALVAEKRASRIAQRSNAPVLSLAVDPASIRYLLLFGLTFYGVVSRVAGSITGLQALVATGSSVLVVALGLEIWRAHKDGRRTGLVVWLLVPLALPLISVITQGFLGYGFGALLTVYAFAGSFLRPRWKVLVASLLLGYVGISIYITYMRDRRDIRATVWGGASFDARADQLLETMKGMEWFDYRDISHLRRVDERLNQNALVGAAAVRLQAGLVNYADGSTLKDAALSLIPRVLWPDKPVVGGSGDMVATYTGLRFAEGTSVGVGQILECYINFGTTGVVTIFLLIGGLLAFIDRSAAGALDRADVFGFTLWYLPALGLLQVGGSFAEVVATTGAGWLVALTLKIFATRFLGSNGSVVLTAAPAGADHSGGR